MTTTTILPVLKQGSAAYFDSMSGPIPCKIDAIVSDQPCDLRPSSHQKVTATVTKDGRNYKKGQHLESWGLFFFPRKALGHSKFHLYIKPYQVQA